MSDESAIARLWKDCTPRCDAAMGIGECTCGAVHFNAGLGALAAERAASPPQEVVEAAERLLELAGTASPVPWRAGSVEKCSIFAIDDKLPWSPPEWLLAKTNHAEGTRQDEAEANAAFIAECRTLAPLIAAWVKGGGK